LSHGLLLEAALPGRKNARRRGRRGAGALPRAARQPRGAPGRRRVLLPPRRGRPPPAGRPKSLSGKDREEWLASIWSGPAKRNAFTHVLCGDEWDREALGGLHLESRYAQLEREGKVCYDGSARTFGDACSGGQCLIRYRGVKGFSCGVKETGGFVQGFDALDMLAAGTRAFLTCCLGRRGAIIRESARYKGPRGVTFQIACGDRNGIPGIVTFYPIDDTPDCGP